MKLEAKGTKDYNSFLSGELISHYKGVKSDMLTFVLSYITLLKDIDFSIVKRKGYILLIQPDNHRIKLHLQELADYSDKEWLEATVEFSNDSTWAIVMAEQAKTLDSLLKIKHPESDKKIKELTLKVNHKIRGSLMDYSCKFSILF